MAIPGSVVAAGKLVTPGGAQGPLGPAGPNAVSADPGNIATIGSDSLILVPQSTIWNQRLRSLNILGNPNFEVSQRLQGASNISSGLYPADRWQYIRSGATAQLYSSQATSYAVVIPGTSFRITNCILNTLVQTAQASLSAGDIIYHVQNLEGPQIRELASDVFSISLLVQSNVAGLKFTVSFRDNPSTKSLVKLCTIPTAGAWTVIQLPNVPAFPSGNFAVDPGQVGGFLTITLACGSTYIAPAADTWQSGNFVGAAGMSNFALTLNNSMFVAFVQMEPGPVCTQFIDKPFAQNYQECLRYYQKSVPYITKPGTGSAGAVQLGWIGVANGTNARGCVQLSPPMAKNPPAFTVYSVTSPWAANTAYVDLANTSANVSSVSGSEKVLAGLNFSPAATNTTPSGVLFDYVADTGW